MTSTPGLAETAVQTPTRDDRLLAGLAHLAFLGGFWLVAPVAIYVLKRKESAFVAFHALQAAFLALAAIPLTLAIWAGMVGLGIASVTITGHHAGGALAMLWLAALVVPGLTVAGVSLVAGLRALRGESWSIPVLGRIAQGVLNAPES